MRHFADLGDEMRAREEVLNWVAWRIGTARMQHGLVRQYMCIRSRDERHGQGKKMHKMNQHFVRNNPPGMQSTKRIGMRRSSDGQRSSLVGCQDVKETSS